MSYLMVIPFAYGPYFDACMETIDETVRQNVFAVDNTENNRGVAESWNLGIDEMRRRKADWLVVCSAAIRFDAGALEFDMYFDGLLKDAHLVHFCTPDYYEADGSYQWEQYKRGVTRGYDEGMFAWHLTALKNSTLDEVGYFDPNLYPAGFEDLDYDLRLNKTYGDELNFPIVPIAAHPTTLNHGIKLGGVKAPAGPLIEYYATKWGIHPNAWRFGGYEHPFNETDKSLKYFPPNLGRHWDATT